MKTVSAQFIDMSVAIGKDVRFVQGGGGNTSAKTPDGRTLLVKASGTSLAEMTQEAGFRELDLAKVLAILDDEQLAARNPVEREQEIVARLNAACTDQRTGRPSVESCLHALLGPFVIHTHPTLVNGLLCARGGKGVLLSALAADAPNLLYIGYSDPGFPLARLVRKSLRAFEKAHGRLPQLVFLENHGLFVSADTPAEALALTHRVHDAVETAVSRAPKPARSASEPPASDAIRQCAAAIRRCVRERGKRPALLRLVRSDVVADMLSRPNRRALLRTRALVPDQIVYLGERIAFLSLPPNPARTAEHLSRQLDALGEPVGNAFFVDRVGLFVAGDNIKSLDTNEEVANAALGMLLTADAFGGPRALTPKAARYIAEWEVEAFRRALVVSRGAGALAGKVAVVSGGGSGIGRGVCLGLAREGATVVLADIDENAAGETREMIRSECGRDQSVIVRVDVTSEESVAAAFQHAVERLGGVDILVNAAGIAPISPLIDFPLAAWRKTLEINLTGYFLMAREAARCMVAQKTGGSIVNISSKTGLDASKNHSAYNATKSGEIHLARGWALELAEHKIRVNAICPGNVFRGSKIWNPDYIKAIGKKRGLKPEEVIPYYINLTALKEEITWDDIANGVVFLASERASKITGQTLVIDAGQVFVR